MDRAANSSGWRIQWRKVPLFFVGLIGWLAVLLLVVLAMVWLAATSTPLGLDGWSSFALLSGAAILLAMWLLFLPNVVRWWRMGWATTHAERHTTSNGSVWWVPVLVLPTVGNGIISLLLRPNAPPALALDLLAVVALLLLPTGTTRQGRVAGEGDSGQVRPRTVPLFLAVFRAVAIFLPDRLWHLLHRARRTTTPLAAHVPNRHVPPALRALLMLFSLLVVTGATVALVVIEAPGIFPISMFGPKDVTHALAWASDGSRIAALEEDANQVLVWDANISAPALRLACPNAFGSLGWSPENTFLAADCAGQNENFVTIWDARTGTVVQQLPGTCCAQDFAWSPYGDVLALLVGGDGSDTATIQFWNIAQGTQVAMFPLTSAVGVGDMAWSPDGRWLAVTEEHGVLILAADTGEAVQYFSDSSNDVTNIAWSPDSTRLLVATFLPDDASGPFSLFFAPDRRVSVWDVATSRRTLALLEQPTGNLSIAWSPTSRVFAVASEAIDGVTQVYDAHTGQVRFTVRGQRQITALAWSPDGQAIATSEFDGLVAVWKPVL